MASYYPPVGFHFLVKFEDFSEEIDTYFQEVSGLSVTINTEDYAEGGVNQFVHKLPKGTTYDNLVLKRGIIKNSKILQWCKQAVENLHFEPKNLLVSLLNESHDELCSWNIVHAYPVKWSFSGLNAESSELLIESIELNYHYFILKIYNMPIEIRELVIKATVSTAESNPDGSATSGSEPDASREEKIVARCVEQVMEILRIQKER